MVSCYITCFYIGMVFACYSCIKHRFFVDILYKESDVRSAAELLVLMIGQFQLQIPDIIFLGYFK